MEKSKLIYCVDGPLKGNTYTALIKGNRAYLPLHNNPFYKTAVYFTTNETTFIGETIGLLSHCLKREKI